MTDVILFTCRNMPVRVVEVDGEHLFVVRDICNILGLSNPNRELSRYTENVPRYERLRTPGGLQIVRLVPRFDVEKLLYSVPGKRAGYLQDWLAREVYPALENNSGNDARLPPWKRRRPMKPEESNPEYDEVRNLLLGHLTFMHMLMSVPVEQQPGVIFGIPEIPVNLKLKRGRKHDR